MRSRYRSGITYVAERRRSSFCLDKENSLRERAGRGLHLLPGRIDSRCNRCFSICSYIQINGATPGRTKVHIRGITGIGVFAQEFDPILALDCRGKSRIKRVRSVRVNQVVKGIILNVGELGCIEDGGYIEHLAIGPAKPIRRI
jgi:hypothetical protein